MIMSIAKNYKTLNIGALANLEKDYQGKLFVGQELGLTSCETSMNYLPASEHFPFVHAHKMNEELYIVISGKGVFYIDGEEFSIQEGSFIKVTPNGARSIKAINNLIYICVQAQSESLMQSTKEDGYIVQSTPSWVQVK